MRLSNSKAKTWRRCPNQFRYKYVMKLRPKAKGLPLEKGSWMHSLLQAMYEGRSWKKEHKRLTKVFLSLWDEEREALGDLPGECKRLMVSYMRQYPNDRERYKVIDCEFDEIVTLPNGLKLQIIIDLIVEDLIEGGLWIWDHKFRGKLADSDDMLMDPQLTLYYWALEHIMGYPGIRGTMYNEVRTATPKVPKLLKSGGLSQRMNIDTDYHTYMAEIKRHDLDPSDYTTILTHIATNEEIRFFRRTPIPKDPPVVKTVVRELVETAQEIQEAERKNRFPRTVEKSCKWYCDYKNICIAEMHGADIQSIIKTDFVVAQRFTAQEEK